MKKGEHTPGPWNVEHDTEIIAAEGKRIAEADTRSINFVNGEANANARLIAAAPDLLAAAEALLEEARQFFPTVSGNAITIGEAAVKKARGEK